MYYVWVFNKVHRNFNGSITAYCKLHRAVDSTGLFWNKDSLHLLQIIVPPFFSVSFNMFNAA